MKTINFLHIVKYPVLLFIALFGLFIGGSENVPNQLPKPRTIDIGGQGAPRVPSLQTETNSAPLNYADNSVDIGGQSVPRSGYLLKPETQKIADAGTVSTIGGQGAPRVPGLQIGGQNAPRTGFASIQDEMEIGGQSAPCLLTKDGADIGGAQTAPRGIYEIGGGQTAPRTFAHHDCQYSIPVEIKPIGGSQSVPRMFAMNGNTVSGLSSFRWSLGEIGGNGSQLPKPTFSLQPIGGPGNPPRT